MTAPRPDTTLDALRREIDMIDGEILGLLQRRFAATGRVKATKSHDGSIALSPFRPAREATMMRRLLAEAGPSVPPETLVRLWRVILSASTQSQAPVTLHMDEALGRDPAARIEIAQHFCAMPAAIHRSASAALEALHDHRGDLAVVATASDWTSAHAAAGSSGAQVVGSLPVIDGEAAPRFLLFGHAEPLPTGDDETLLVLPAGEPVPAPATWQLRAGSALLVGVPGFLAPESLAPAARFRIAGRYPRPIKVPS